jgi:CheY-like chemotaxis protein
LRLGDNTTVNFEKSLIFFTSNLGAREMMKEINPNIGFQSVSTRTQTDLTIRLESIALGAVRKRFSPEFVNRIDAVVTYRPLDSEAMEMILNHDIRVLQEHVNSRLGDRCFSIEMTPESRAFLLRKGVSQEYGARELKRTIHRELTQPLATLVTRSEISPGAQVRVSVSGDSESLSIVSTGAEEPVAREKATILIVDDNHDLLLFLAGELRQAGWRLLTAETAPQARLLFYQDRPGVILLDYMLNKDDGLKLGLEFQNQDPLTQIVLMTGGGLSDAEQSLCEERAFPILYKPFLASDLLNLVKGRSQRASAVGAT